MIIPPITDPRQPKIGMTLLAKQPSMGPGEFDKECAYWMLETLNDMTYKPPIIPPPEVIEYRRRKQENMDYEVTRDFWVQPHIIEYKRSCDRVFAENRSHWFWLGWMLKKIPKEDELNIVKIRKIQATYPQGEPIDHIVKDPQINSLMKSWYEKELV